jgi:hypothetical protein
MVLCRVSRVLEHRQTEVSSFEVFIDVTEDGW